MHAVMLNTYHSEGEKKIALVIDANILFLKKPLAYGILNIHFATIASAVLKV